MPGMDSSVTGEDVGPTEDTIMALLDLLVDPLLPSKSSRGKISPSQEELIAKQMHAVVLLYNYYHRKRHPRLEFLDFDSFCKLAVGLKPNLVSCLRVMQEENSTELDVQLSMTEKSIMDACYISKSLDASRSSPIIEGWPIAKVAVFLVDFKEEQCYLLHSSITQGVWSVVEKDIDVTSHKSGGIPVGKDENKKKKITKKGSEDDAFLQLALLAVKEAVGIHQGNLRTLEDHIVYSIGKEKTTVRLYVMQCTQVKEDLDLVPINDVVESLQGPLIIKDSGSWILTPVVEYFHLLPFANLISDWLAREKVSNGIQSPHLKPEESGQNSAISRIEAAPAKSTLHNPGTEEERNCNELVLNNLQVSETAKQVRVGNRLDSINKPRLRNVESFKVINETRTGIGHHHKEEQLLHTPQLSEAVKEVVIGDAHHLKVDTLLCTPEHLEPEKDVRNSINSNLKESLLKTSLPSEATEDVLCCDNNHVKAEFLPPTSNLCETGEEVGPHLKEETLTYYHERGMEDGTSRNPKSSEALQESVEVINVEEESLPLISNLCETGEEVGPHLKEVFLTYYHERGMEDGNSRNLKSSEALQESVEVINVEEESLPLISNLCETGEKVVSRLKEETLPYDHECGMDGGNSRNLNSSQALQESVEVVNGPSKEEGLPYSPGHSEATTMAENNNDTCRKLKGIIVYRKRKRSQKDCSSLTGSSNGMDVSTSASAKKNNGLPHKTLVDDQKQIILMESSDKVSVQGGAIIAADAVDSLPILLDIDGRKALTNGKMCDAAMSELKDKQDDTSVDLNVEHLHKLQLTIASRKDLLEKTALNVLFRKRERLTEHCRSIEADIALCEKNINTILSGTEDGLAVMIDSIIEGCNDKFLGRVPGTEDRLGQQLGDPEFPSVAKRERLQQSELCLYSPSQELENICRQNSWMSPAYHVSLSKGAFQASVTVKGGNFECSSQGEVCSSPAEARNSAASSILLRVRGIAVNLQGAK